MAGPRRDGISRRLPLGLLGAVLAAYLIVPVALVLGRIGPGHWNGIGDRSLWQAVLTSVMASTIATALVALLGVPLAWLLARRRRPGWSRRAWNTVGVLVQLPLALPPLVSGLLLIRLVGPYTWLGRLSGQRLTESVAGIVLAQAFVAGPFLIVAARSAFATVDPELDAVAATLGHGRWSRFFRVDVAEAAPGIRAGLVLCWLRAFGEFGATVLLAYHPYSLPVYTYVRFGSTGLPATDVPVTVAIGIALVVAATGQLRVRRRLPRILPAPAPAAPVRSAPRLAFSVAADLDNFVLRAAHRASSPRLALLGPSGAGKTLTVRALAGVGEAASARVTLEGERLDGRSAEHRGVGYVPQGGGLLPRLPVWHQVTFAVGADPAVAAWWLNRLGLDGLERRRPSELSGGQAQRVALARALVRAGAGGGEGRLLLLDEPLCALDTPTRRRLRDELRRLQADAGLATVVVTHDPEEAAVLADEIVVLHRGRVLQAGTTRQLFDTPASVTVARLLDVPNVHAGRAAGPATVDAGSSLRLAAVGLDAEAGQPVLWNVEPTEVVPTAGAGLAGRVVDVVDHGRFVEATLRLEPPAGAAGGITLASRHPAAARLVAGTVTGVRLPPVRAWLPAVSGGPAAVGPGEEVDDLVDGGEVLQHGVGPEAAQVAGAEAARADQEAVRARR